MWISPFWEKDSSEQMADNRSQRVALRLLPFSAGFYRRKKWIAAGLVRLDGASRNHARVTVSRENGKLGGRDRYVKPLSGEVMFVPFEILEKVFGR